MTVSDNTILAEGLNDLSKNRGKKGPDVSQSMAKNVLKSPGTAFDISANVASAVASRNFKAALL